MVNLYAATAGVLRSGLENAENRRSSPSRVQPKHKSSISDNHPKREFRASLDCLGQPLQGTGIAEKSIMGMHMGGVPVGNRRGSPSSPDSGGISR